MQQRKKTDEMETIDDISANESDLLLILMYVIGAIQKSSMRLFRVETCSVFLRPYYFIIEMHSHI